jgi:hypothetical protein
MNRNRAPRVFKYFFTVAGASENDTAHQTGAGSATPVWCGA